MSTANSFSSVILIKDPMEGNEKLLKIAINLHYHDNLKIVTKATEIIQNYCSKEQTNLEYDKVLKNLHDLMNDLPPNILLYFLTTVPLPKQEDGSTSTFSDLIKKSRASLLDNMHSVLTEYINTMQLVTSDDYHVETEYKVPEVENEEEEDEVIKTEPEESLLLKQKIINVDSKDTVLQSECSSKRTKYYQETHKTLTKCCEKLLEISAEYIVQNLGELQQYYNQKNKEVWSFVNKNVCSAEEQVQCYKYIEDVNRKLKWLRMIEARHISADVIKELYGDSEIFLKEQQLHNLFDESIFSVSEELREAIKNFVDG